MFSKCSNPQEIKDLYRKLALENHPDRPNGSTTRMQDINEAYTAALKGQHGHKSVGTDGKTRTYKYSEATEQAIIDFLNSLFATGKIDETIRVRLIGLWIWVDGETRPIKDALKSVKMVWHSKRKCWYWKPYKGKGRYNKRASLDDLAATYGSAQIKGKRTQRQTQPALMGAS